MNCISTEQPEPTGSEQSIFITQGPPNSFVRGPHKLLHKRSRAEHKLPA